MPAFSLQFPTPALAVFSALVGVCPADSSVLTIGCGYLCDAGGTAAANRLPVDTLCVLIADMRGDGFDPPFLHWAEDDDVLVTVSDAEYPAASGGTKQFDLADGVTEAGLLSLSLAVDLSQFGGRTAPVPVALRWFPAYRAHAVDVSRTQPAPGSAYGEFTRSVPLYPETGSVGWFVSMTAGINVTLDPLATGEFGGVDQAVAGLAAHVTAAPYGLTVARAENGGRTLRFKGGAGLRYQVQRGPDLQVWPDTWTVTASGAGEGAFTDFSHSPGFAYYRVRGPLPN